MNSGLHFQKLNFSDFVFPIVFFLVPVLVLIGCKVEKSRPATVPKNAAYEKKRNLYTQIENGIRRTWIETGELYSECQLDEQGREHGECKNYFPKTGKVVAEGKNIHGERDGVWHWYFPDGKIYYKLTLAHDKKRPVWIETNLLGNEHGPYERFYEDGKLDERGSYDGGYRTGSWEKFYRSGRLEYKGNYKKDKKTEDWKYYYSDGTLEVEEKFDSEGILIYRKTYFPDGKLNCEVNKLEKVEKCKSPI